MIATERIAGTWQVCPRRLLCQDNSREHPYGFVEVMDTVELAGMIAAAGAGAAAAIDRTHGKLSLY